MRSLSRWTSSLLFTFLGTAALLAVCFPAQGIDAGYIRCSLRDLRSTSTTIYFSAVFEGDISNSVLFMNAFNAYVHANYTDVRGSAACTSASDRPAARADQDHEKDAPEKYPGHTLNEPSLAASPGVGHGSAFNDFRLRTVDAGNRYGQ